MSIRAVEEGSNGGTIACPLPPAGLFERLYHDNHAKVYRLALGLTGNESDAEEITQEAFFKAFRSYHTFRADSSFFTWIYRITFNIASDYMKQRARLPVYPLPGPDCSIEAIADISTDNDPSGALLAREARVKCLHLLTECLSLNQRKVLCLAFVVGLPYKLIAEILDRSVGWVKITLYRAKQRIAGYLEERCQLIKKANPCNCRQWVGRGLKEGWITEPASVNPRPEVVIQAERELVKLGTLRQTYQSLYPETVDQSLTQRIRQGIKCKEWAIFS